MVYTSFLSKNILFDFADKLKNQAGEIHVYNRNNNESIIIWQHIIFTIANYRQKYLYYTIVFEQLTILTSQLKRTKLPFWQKVCKWKANLHLRSYFLPKLSCRFPK